LFLKHFLSRLRVINRCPIEFKNTLNAILFISCGPTYNIVHYKLILLLHLLHCRLIPHLHRLKSTLGSINIVLKVINYHILLYILCFKLGSHFHLLNRSLPTHLLSPPPLLSQLLLKYRQLLCLILQPMSQLFIFNQLLLQCPVERTWRNIRL
jgi:hypothetical protein